MANAIKTKTTAKANFTITLASLANNAARQSTMIDNSSDNYGRAMVYLRMKSSGTTPTAGSVYEVYLIRGDDPSSSTYRTDNAGASDAAITIENATLLGAIAVTANANKNFYGEFSTRELGPLGPEWGIAVKNVSGQAVSATGSDFLAEYVYVYDEIQ